MSDAAPVLAPVPPIARALALAVVVLGVGAAALNGLGADDGGDPTASVDNGAPRGLLAARLLLERRGPPIVVARALGPLAPVDAPLATAPVDWLVIVPPPERSALSPDEATELLALIDAGARVLVLCDADERRVRRLGPLLDAAHVTCGVDTEAPASSTATSLVPGVPAGIALRDRARLRLQDGLGVLPLAAVGDEPVVVATARGRGELVVLASASSVANDGLGEGEGAALLAWLAHGRRVIVDERHHASRGRALAARAILQGPGPLSAVVAALLLVLGSIAALGPRRGDAPDDDDGGAAASTEARVRGLAALLGPRPPDSTAAGSASSPPAPATYTRDR